MKDPPPADDEEGDSIRGLYFGVDALGEATREDDRVPPTLEPALEGNRRRGGTSAAFSTDPDASRWRADEGGAEDRGVEEVEDEALGLFCCLGEEGPPVRGDRFPALLLDAAAVGGEDREEEERWSVGEAGECALGGLFFFFVVFCLGEVALARKDGDPDSAVERLLKEGGLRRDGDGTGKGVRDVSRRMDPRAEGGEPMLVGLRWSCSIKTGWWRGEE